VPRRVSIRGRIPRREAGSPAGNRLDDLPDHRGDLLPLLFLMYICPLDNVNTNLYAFSNDFRNYTKKLIKNTTLPADSTPCAPKEDDMKELRRGLASTLCLEWRHPVAGSPCFPLLSHTAHLVCCHAVPRDSAVPTTLLGTSRCPAGRRKARPDVGASGISPWQFGGIARFDAHDGRVMLTVRCGEVGGLCRHGAAHGYSSLAG
jgi:hypothetical protein